jgi:hypothetical protein
LISFGDDGRILVSNDLLDIDRTFLNVRDDMKIELTEGNRKYLEYHRARFESKEQKLDK